MTAAGDGLPPLLGAAAGPRPQRQPRLVCIDLDGTALDHHQRCHPRTRDAIRRTVAGGVPVIIATGRMFRSALPWAVELGVTEPLVCYQGAVVRALPRPEAPAQNGVRLGELLFEDGLGAATAVAAVTAARRGGWHVQAYLDELLLCEQDRPEAHLYARIAQVPITFVDDLLPWVEERGSVKVVCVVDDPAEADRCEAAIRSTLGSGARVTRSLPPFIEATDPSASKGRALRRLCSRLGLDLADAVAIGDAPNDVDMLEACGFAVAVAGGRPEVLAAADALCAVPEQAGVADVLELLGLG